MASFSISLRAIVALLRAGEPEIVVASAPAGEPLESTPDEDANRRQRRPRRRLLRGHRLVGYTWAKRLYDRDPTP